MRYTSLPGRGPDPLPVSPILSDAGATIDAMPISARLSWSISSTRRLHLMACLPGVIWARTDGLELKICRLSNAGLPTSIDEGLTKFWSANPQLIPAPAFMSFTPEAFGGAQRLSEDVFQSLVSGAGHDAAFPFSSPATGEVCGLDRQGNQLDLHALSLAAFMSGDIGLIVAGGTKLATVDPGQRIELSFFDYRTYAAIDQPRAVLSANRETGATLPRRAEVQAVFAGSACDRTNRPDQNATDLAQTLIRDRGTVRFAGMALLKELDVVIRYRDAGSIQHVRFELDRFEKYAVFPARPEWHFRSWIRAGVLPDGLRDPLISQILDFRLYPSNANGPVLGLPGRGDSISPPQPMTAFSPSELAMPSGQRRADGFDGELGGADRPTYAYDPQRLRFRLERRDGRRDPDRVHTSRWRDLGDVHYEGALGLEEYVKRVIASEYFLGWRAPAGVDLGGMERIRNGLMVQALAARSYVLFRWFSDQKRLRNPIATNYEEQRMPDTAAFQVHRLDKLHAEAQREDRRVALEDAMAETWGQVITFRGKYINSEYYAGDRGERTGCGGSAKPYVQPVRTFYGVNCRRATPGSDYSRAHGHGRGFSQKGSRLLAAQGLSYLQLAHWYFYGTHIRNGYGMGDFISRLDEGLETEAAERLVSEPSETIVDHQIDAHDGQWRCHTHDGMVAKADAENWHVSHNFMAHEFCRNMRDGGDQPLRVHHELVAKLQNLRFSLGDPVRIKGIAADGQSVEATSRNARFRRTAQDIFGDDHVSDKGASGTLILSM